MRMSAAPKPVEIELQSRAGRFFHGKHVIHHAVGHAEVDQQESEHGGGYVFLLGNLADLPVQEITQPLVFLPLGGLSLIGAEQALTFRCHLRLLLAPVQLPPSRIGGWKASPVSQGKKIHVSWDTSVMK